MASDDLDAEYRAWELLRWSTPAPWAAFDEGLADSGFYTQVQQRRSNEALKAEEAAQAGKPTPLTELSAFRELVAMGVFTEVDFYLPSKAAHSHYTNELRKHKQQQQQRGVESRQSMDGRHEESARLRVGDDRDLPRTRQVARPAQLRGWSRPRSGPPRH